MRIEMTVHHPIRSAQIEEKTQCSLPSKMNPPDPSSSTLPRSLPGTVIQVILVTIPYSYCQLVAHIEFGHHETVCSD